MGANHDNAEELFDQAHPRHCAWKAEDGIRTRDPHHGKVMFYH